MNNAQQQKLELIEWLVNLQDKTLIAELSKWKEFQQKRLIEKYNKELDEANERIDLGEFVTNVNVKEESRQWLK